MEFHIRVVKIPTNWEIVLRLIEKQSLENTVPVASTPRKAECEKPTEEADEDYSEEEELEKKKQIRRRRTR